MPKDSYVHIYWVLRSYVSVAGLSNGGLWTWDSDKKTLHTATLLSEVPCIHPHHSIIRKLLTKSAILITVADDFYDMEGSLAELQTLTETVQR